MDESRSPAPRPGRAQQRMHDDEIDIDEDLVRRLLATQFPQWATLSLERITPEGTVNAIFRLGDAMAVRLPRIPRHQDPDDTSAWLQTLAPRLPLGIPEPLAMGEPDDGYPWNWSVVRWLEGARFDLARLKDPAATAVQFGEFIQALHAIDATVLPARPPAAPALRHADSVVRDAAERARGLIDTDRFLEAWEEALEVPIWDHEPVLVHRDLGPGNLLIRNGQLTAVIDWGALATGDPVLDIGFEDLFATNARARAAFRSVVPVDDKMRSRIRGWQLCGVVSVAYYAETNPRMAEDARRLIADLLSGTR